MSTLSQYRELANDIVLPGLYKEILTVEEMSALLQFRSINGNTLTYNRESAHPNASVFALGETLQDSEPVTTQKTAALKEVYSQGATDRFAIATLSNVQDPRAVRMMQHWRATWEELGRLFINGDSAVNTKEFDGLNKITRSETRMMAMDDGAVDGPGMAETELTLDRLDQVIDQIKPGRPDALIMNRTMRRKLGSLFRSAGSGVLPTDRNEFGRIVGYYSDIPLVVNDHISNAETYADSGTWPSSTATTIYAVKFGEEKQGLDILHNGAVLTPDFQNLGTKFDKNEDAFRIVLYVSTALYSTLSIIALAGIDSAS